MSESRATLKVWWKSEATGFPWIDVTLAIEDLVAAAAGPTECQALRIAIVKMAPELAKKLEAGNDAFGKSSPMEYEIVCGESPSDLKKAVNAALKDGWILHGQPFTCVLDRYELIAFNQALVRQLNAKEEK